MRQHLIHGAILTLAVLLLVQLAGCQKSAKEIDAEAVFSSLLEQVSYDTELSPVGNNAVLYFADLPENAAVRLYTGGGYSADEAALIILQSESDATVAVKSVENHVEEMRSQFMNYVPEEVGKIDHALVHREGRYVFLCITNDYVSAEQILRNCAESSCQFSKNSETETETEGQKSGEIKTEGQKAEEVKAESEFQGVEMSANTAAETAEEKAQEAEDIREKTYPKLTSVSGAYHHYGTATFRVDGAVFEEYDYVDEAAENYAAVVNKTAEKLSDKTTVYTLIIPTAVGVTLPDDIAEILPGYIDQGEAIQRIMDKMSDRVGSVNCFDQLMQHRDEYLYFRTDHHWNGRGAYYAYKAFCEKKGMAAVTLEERTEKQFEGFLGTYYWKSSNEDPVLAETPDTIQAYYPRSENATMKFTDEKGESHDWSIISDVSEWKASTKYCTFAAGDTPIAEFTNPDVTDNSVCIIVKESFGNALMPYLVDHYTTIYEIDYRYWTGNLIDFAREKSADDLIFANNLSMIRSSLLVGKLAELVG